MRRAVFFVVALLTMCSGAADASAQVRTAPDAASLDAAPGASAPLIRVTGLSPALLLALPTAMSADESAGWENAAAAEMSAAGSKAQFKLWCLALFLGGAGVYWAGDQAGIEFVANTGAFVAVVGLLGLIMPTW